MENFLFGDPLTAAPTPQTRAAKNLATPAPVGSGPEGKTCGGCVFLERVQSGRKVFMKCGKMRAYWTHGAATDIRAKWEACLEFREEPV